MANTYEDINLVKRRCRAESRKPATRLLLDALFEHLQQKRNPDLKWKALDFTANADIVISDVACRIFALVVKKPAASTTSAWIKISDHASVAAANGDIVVPLVGTGGGGQEVACIWPDGVLLNTGATAASHTAVDGNTDSNDADSAAGFAIVGAQ